MKRLEWHLEVKAHHEHHQQRLRSVMVLVNAQQEAEDEHMCETLGVLAVINRADSWNEPEQKREAGRCAGVGHRSHRRRRNRGRGKLRGARAAINRSRRLLVAAKRLTAIAAKQCYRTHFPFSLSSGVTAGMAGSTRLFLRPCSADACSS